MAEALRDGTRVKWKWGPGWARGKVVQRFTDSVTLTIKGAEITRNSTDNNPAYLIVQEDGDRVLKSHSELTRDD